MNRTYEDMSKEELITLVTRLAKQHDEWSDEAKELREQVEYFKGLVDHYKDELLKAMEMSDEAKHLHMMYEELYADWRKVWDILDNMGMAKEMRQEFPNTFFDTMELIE